MICVILENFLTLKDYQNIMSLAELWGIHVMSDPPDMESLPNSLSEWGTSLADWLRSDFFISLACGFHPWYW